MSKLNDCIRDLKLTGPEVAEIRKAAAAARDDVTGVQRFLDSLNDDLEGLRIQLQATAAPGGGYFKLGVKTAVVSMEIATKKARQRRKLPQPEGGADVLTFLASRGGINDNEGFSLLKGRNLQKMTQWGPLIRDTGMSIDRAGEMIWDAGYLGPERDRPGESEILNLIEQARSKPLYLPQIQEAKDAEERALEQMEMEESVRKEIQIAAEEVEIILDAKDIDGILQLMVRERLTPSEAIDAWVERADLDPIIEEAGNRTGDNGYADFDGPDPFALEDQQGGEGGPGQEAPVDTPPARQEGGPAGQQAPPQVERPASYGASNKIVTADRAAELRAKLKNKLNNQLNAGIDPEVLAMGAELAVYHIEAGARKFVDVAQALAQDLGTTIEKLLPYLRGWYNSARDLTEDSGGSVEGMDSPDEVKAALEALKEQINAASSRGGLEQGGGNRTTQDGVGQEDIPFEPVSDGRRDQRLGGATGSAGGSGRGSGGGGLRAPALGEGGNLGDGTQQPAAGAGPAQPGERGGSGDPRVEGASTERVTTDATRKAATKSADLAEKLRAQREASKIDPRPADFESIKETLPFLLPGQLEDVLKAENRLWGPNLPGFLFTNGTGTGKTYVGSGIVARNVRMRPGRRVLVVGPRAGILRGWQRALDNLQTKSEQLEDTQTAGKEQVVVTTFANFRDNPSLMDVDWDLVVFDESHYIQSAQGSPDTATVQAMRAITKHPRGLYARARAQMRVEGDQIDAILAAARAAKRNLTPAETDKYQDFENRVRARAQAMASEERSRVVFLSASPFAYVESIDYAEGYLFEFPKDDPGTTLGYNAGDGRSRFYMEKFGYRMRYNKLTKPDARVNMDVMERAFYEWLVETGAASGRQLELEQDYERRFVLAEDGIGNEIDELMKFLSDADNGKFRPIAEDVRKRFDYLARRRLLEAIKAKAAIPMIEAQLKLGRKVVVFHDYNEGGGINPFLINYADDARTYGSDGKPIPLKRLYDEFISRNPNVAKMRFSDLRAPIDQLKSAFPTAGLINGTVSKKVRLKAMDDFNTDGSDVNVVIVQSDAGREGISLHDTTGNHRRVLINLGMPSAPITAIQQEGRIYREGQVTDALFMYLNTGTSWERWTFAGSIASRSGTAENLAMGNRARTLRQSFIDAFEATDHYEPSDADGKGGKAIDRNSGGNVLTQWTRAKSVYYAQQKKKGRRDQREGFDYYATPEPIGLKMVEFANIKPNESVLEPSAGHGAISRWFPDTARRTIVEPSEELAGRASLASPGARMIQSTFEDLNKVNKYDAIVMNPPFGSGGKLAMEHVAKAFGHLRNGGRVVALIPDQGTAAKRLEDLMDSEAAAGVYIAARIKLPRVTFERAGTSVSGSIYVFEKQIDPDVAQKIQQQDRDYTGHENIEDLFNAIENAEIRDRQEPITKEPEAPEVNELGAIQAGEVQFLPIKGMDDRALSLLENVPKDVFKMLANAARAAGGEWNNSSGGFVFTNTEQRDKFLGFVQDPTTMPAPPAEAPVTAGGVEFKLGQTKHTKSGKDLFVATLASKVSDDVYRAVNAAAKRMGGYYSSWRGPGAVPGFQFPTAEARDNFVKAMSAPAKESRRDVTATPEFRAWFGESKVIDELGEPLVVYHGVPNVDGPQDVDQFFDADAYYFSTSKDVADTYAADGIGSYGATLAVYLSMKDPLIINARGKKWDNFIADQAIAIRDAKAQGKDGVIVRRIRDQVHGGGEVATTYIVFRQEQIKAVDNNGEFSPVDPRIRFSRTEKVQTVDGLMDQFVLGGAEQTPEQAKAAQTAKQMAEIAARQAQSKMRGTKPQEGAGPLFGEPSKPKQGSLFSRSGASENPSRVADFNQAMQARLREVGISEKIIGRVVKEIQDIASGRKTAADGRYWGQLIEIAMGAPDKPWTLNHEIIHALRDLNLFTAMEWRALERSAKNNGALMASIQRRYPDLTAEEQLEEAVADMFANWKRAQKPTGILKAAWDRFVAFLKAMRAAFQSQGYETTSDIFEGIDRGYIGGRDPIDQPGPMGISQAFMQEEVGPVFYSALQRGIEQAKTKKAPAKDWKAIIKSLPGVKAEEIEWSGVNEWLDMTQETLTKEEVLDFVTQNDVTITESIRGAVAALTPEEIRPIVESAMSGLMENSPERDSRINDIIGAIADRDITEAVLLMLQAEMKQSVISDVLAKTIQVDESKYGSLVLPGGSNYREMLFIFQPKNYGLPPGFEVIREPNGSGWGVRGPGLPPIFGWATPEAAALSQVNRMGGTRFESSHFSDVNVIAHIRFNERTDSAGRPVLFIEEIQSDWHQKGRKAGYGKIAPIPKYETYESMIGGAKHTRWRVLNQSDLLLQNGFKTLSEAQEWFNTTGADLYSNEGAPNAPLKKTWHEFAFKRALRWAAENGFDAVGWTTGQQQVDRYAKALRKKVDGVRWEKTEKGIHLVGYKNGREVVNTHEKETALSDAIGKTMADQIIQSPDQAGLIEGDQITVSNTGMAGFYDRILVDYADRIGKKYGAYTEDIEVSANPTEGATPVEVRVVEFTDGTFQVEVGGDTYDFATEESADAFAAEVRGAKKANGIYITPEMRRAVMQGQPKFAAAWHGSPYEFDRFTTDKIGSGEGAQAYGWGLYFAQSKDVARHYKRMLTRGIDLSKINAAIPSKYQGSRDNALRIVNQIQWAVDNGDVPSAKNYLEQYEVADDLVPAYQIAVEMLSQGRVYKVELAPAEDEYLLWDEPLSKQSPKVRESLNELANRLGGIVGNPPGKDIYQYFFDGLHNGKKASLELKAAGIRGIKYLDGSSRRDGEGTYNYVIFDEADVSIKEKFSRRDGSYAPPSPDVGRGGVSEQLREVARQVAAGKATAGDYAAALAGLNYEAMPWESVPPLPTEQEIREALARNQQAQVFAARDLPAGTPVHLRLDVPAQERKGVWVPTIHAANNQVVGYDTHAAVTGATFHLPQSTALKIATGEKSKTPFSWIKGGFKPMTAGDAVRKAQEIIQSGDPNWIQVGMNPRKHSYFFDRARPERPVVAADEVIQVGPIILAKNPKYGDAKSVKYSRREQEPIVAFENEETERRWQDARQGVSPAQSWIASVAEWLDEIVIGFTRHFRALPNASTFYDGAGNKITLDRFGDVREQLRKLEASPQAAKESIVRILFKMTEGMTPADLDLFTRKVVLDDLAWEVEQDHDLPFGFTPQTVQAELARVDAALTPELLQKVRQRKVLVSSIAQQLVDAGVLHKDQIKNPAYYRHQVLDYARAEVSRAQNVGERIRSPHWAKRMGSTLDINANLLEAEFDWLHKALVDIETAKVLKWIRESELNVRDELIQKGREHNRRLVSAAIDADIQANGYMTQTKKPRLTSPMNEAWIDFRRRIAMGMKQVTDAISEGSLSVPAEFEDILTDIELSAQQRAAEAADDVPVAERTNVGSDSPNMLRFLAWVLENGGAGSQGAAMAFKAINARKVWTKNLLGTQYADSTDIPGLVKLLGAEGFTAWQPDEGKILFTAKTIPEHVVDKLMERIADVDLKALPKEEILAAMQSVRSMVAVGGDKYHMVIPTALADTLTQFRDDHTQGLIDALAATPLAYWKRWILINPRRVLKYNINNLSGDMDAVIAGNPSAIRKMPQAIRELWDVMIKNKEPSARYREAVERGVFDSGLTVQEIPDIAVLDQFEHFFNKPKLLEEPGRWALRLPLRIWRALQKYTQFRENWLRYAAYLDYADRIEAGETVPLGASNPAQIAAVTDPKDKAALMARDLVGDYGAVSYWGQEIRRKLMPFWSWMEINTKRYWRLNANAWGQGVGRGLATSGYIGATLGIRTTAYLYLRMAALYILVNLWNNLLFGDDEEKLNELDRTRLHINFGTWGGEVRLLRFQGAFSDFLSWFGFDDARVAFSEVMKGRASIDEVIEILIKAPVKKLSGSLTPLITLPLEAATGLKFWPDTFDPRVIRDPWRNFFQAFSVEHEYDLLAGKATRGYDASLVKTVIESRDVGEAAYNTIRGLTYDWLEKNKGQEGMSTMRTPRSVALYEWRLAKKYGDKDAEREAFQKMRALGMTPEDRKRSIDRAHPLGAIALKDRDRFMRTLTARERAAVKTAGKWYRETFLGDAEDE